MAINSSIANDSVLKINDNAMRKYCFTIAKNKTLLLCHMVQHTIRDKAGQYGHYEAQMNVKRAYLFIHDRASKQHNTGMSNRQCAHVVGSICPRFLHNTRKMTK